MDLRPLIAILAQDPVVSEAISSRAKQKNVPMPRGVIAPLVALLTETPDTTKLGARKRRDEQNQHAERTQGGGAQSQRGERTQSGSPQGQSGSPQGQSGSPQSQGGGAQGPENSQLQVVVTPTGRGAEELAGALRAYLPEDAVEVFPSWETLPHERLSPRADTVARRILVQRRLARPEEFAPLRVLLMPVRALLQPLTAGLGELAPVRVRLGEQARMEDIEAGLAAAAYTRVDMVERRGEFAVRGGILDVFPPTEAHPLRVEFFGDDVEEIRSFSVADQRSIAEKGSLYAPPCREILLTDAVRERAKQLQAELPGAVDMLEKISEGIPVEGMESLAPALVEKMVPVVETLPPDARIIVAEPETAAQRAESLLQTTEEFMEAAWSAAAAGGPVPVAAQAANFATLEETEAQARKRGQAWWTIAGFTAPENGGVQARQPRKFLGKVDEAIAEIRRLSKAGWRTVLVTQGAGLGRRLTEQLGEAGAPASFSEDLPARLETGVTHVTTAPIGEGFILTEQHFALLAAADITSRGGSSTRAVRKLPKRRKTTVDPLSLRPGDFVVHERHGVGKFVRMEKRAIGAGRGNQREYLVLEYAPSKRGQPGDQLWVPTDQLDQISRYAGGESPKLNKMGGADWAKTKQKARAATRQIASELTRLYAQRLATPGHAFSPDTPWQRELEDAFEYVETPDQLHTIEEVKRDMERPAPMDRLISGDVGYGKTEIAVRAAFKAVMDNKQVAVLVPTTLLVDQHRETFEERYSGFPVKVAALSRFQSEKESAQVIAGVRDGTIDVVIGTHRLLTGNVRFKDLGLVVIDEEQRFGVEHKETLKQMYPNVDVLSMSATPIPRTLEMAVTGVREMSTLATPPEERHPILTYVGVFENKQVSAAIRRELLRDGQVFFVHNRVQDLPRVAAKIRDLVPEARIAIAHGQMGERQLEEVIQQFWEHEIDVLLCTTIVETGLDIANANTLIVDNADKMGLSQLHQLRGRVGRGRERAYAYFLYDPDHTLTETALERLRTIASNTDLGAGMQVAMKDLEIRGAGNMLGGQQSGHIEGVGFDLYVRMVSEAVARIRGEAAPEDDAAAEVRIELPVEAYLAEDYVPSERLRLEIYGKIANARDDAQRAEVREEMIDRYGELPEAAERLFTLARLRELARRAGLTEITVAGRNLRFAPVQLPDSKQARLRRLHPRALLKPAIRTLLVPIPDAGGKKLGQSHLLEGDALIEWVADFIHSIFLASIGSAPGVND
ncbi:transcription-repair coupling factor [Actinobaculum suis]|uniref:transcription-repair coupling factor n=1 Tax=Actinobaculum suis TaxID=1657 RepID=UPI000ABC4F5A|nr:transcription-repair coupling factor [Actinobaculum suis]